eukprot:4047444-Pleurochrysis_carterae.AAC.1
MSFRQARTEQSRELEALKAVQHSLGVDQRKMRYERSARNKLTEQLAHANVCVRELEKELAEQK